MDSKTVKKYFTDLHEELTNNFINLDIDVKLTKDLWNRSEGGGGNSNVFENGNIIEKGCVNLSDVSGLELPESSTSIRKDLKGREFRAMGVSLVIHPRNPFVPTCHFNIRFFIAHKKHFNPIWWFGGGFDLTPYYGFKEDAIHWHKNAYQACKQFGTNIYYDFKSNCDNYFYLPHRKEQRGIGGLFFDDLNQPNFDQCFELTKSIGNHFLSGYLPIVERRKNYKYDENERSFQNYRRSRYVEFNLIYDRGTLFGLQTNGRTESILMSLPPIVHWKYNFSPNPGSKEYDLYNYYLKPRDWLNENDK